MKLLVRLSAVMACVSLLAACQKAPAPYDYTSFKTANPHSILVIPVVNKSTQVDAPDNFLATLAPPLAERGYYVFPVNMVKHTMEDDGLSDADLVSSANPVTLAGLFGADAVLFASIEHWESHYLLITTSTEVQVHYTLKSGKTGATLWDKTITTVYQPQGASGNPIAALIVDAITAAIERAHPSYIPLANQSNTVAFYTKDQGLLAGPYDGNYKKD